MGRFYQTSDPQFIDFVYKPPFELMKEALDKEQGDYDIALAKASLYEDIPIEYIEDPVEKQRVADIQKKYADRAINITQQLQSSGNDWRSFLPQIDALKREVTQDYKTGDINNIQKSAQAFQAMNKQLETIKDPATREAAKKYWMKEWQKNPNRSGDNIFRADDSFDKQDIMGKFLTHLKQMEPDIFAKATATSNGKYIDTKSMSTEQLAGLDKVFQNFVNSEGYDPYFRQQQDYGLGNYFNDKGERLAFTDPNNTLAPMVQYAKDFEYTKQKADAKKDEDQYGLQRQAFEFDIAKMNHENTLKAAAASGGGSKEKVPTSFNKDASFVYKYTTQGKEVVKQYNRELGVVLNSIGVTNPKLYDVTLDKIRNNPKLYPGAAAKIFELDNQFNANMLSGSEYFRRIGATKEQMDKIEKNFQQPGLEKTLAKHEGTIDFGSLNGKQYGSVGFTKGKKVNIINLKGKTLREIGIESDDTIADVKIVPKTATFTPAANINPETGLPQSGVACTLEITTENGRVINPEFHITGDPLQVGL